MDKAWDYDGLKTLVGKGPKLAFLSVLCSELFRWTKEVTESHRLFPGGYTEWTLAGHFAIAASRKKYLPFQDAMIKSPKSKAKNASNRRRRPDLYIDGGKDKPRVFFQFKQGATRLVKIDPRETIKILPHMREANKQLKEIRGIADAMEWPADWGCCALGLVVEMNWQDAGGDLWHHKQYNSSWDGLKERFQEVLENNKRKFLDYGKAYYSWYRMPHSLVQKQRDWAEKYKWNPPIGMLWVFTVKEWDKLPKIR